MPLVEAKCTKCGAALTVDDSKEAMVCQYCGEAFIVEKAINNYNITNNIQAGVVNVYGGTSDFEIKAGELIKYTGASVNVTIPNTVRIIGEKAFMGLKIESVSIPNSVTSIRHHAFSGCRSLTSITIPNSVSEIGGGAFRNCTSLKKCVLSNNITCLGYSYEGGTFHGFFEGCTSLTSITIPNSVTSIGDSAFKGCKSLTSVTIPNSVTSIGANAFYDCSSLKSITIPNSVTYIGNGAFALWSSITRITVGSGNKDYTTVDGILYDKHKTILHICPKDKQRVTIPNSVTIINDDAFRGCTNLTSVTIPDSVEVIGANAFLDCTSLTSVTIPDSVTRICNEAFRNCSSLTSITIPRSVKIMGYGLFDGCPNVKVKKEGCYIATAVYGSYDAPEVMTLRRFRDDTLKKTFLGRLFIRAYYTLSPPIAKKLKNAHKINGFVRRILDRWVDKLNRKQ